MNQEIIHVYLMPGMAANPKIFEYIKLPKERFAIHYLEWLIPTDNESLEDYAIRISGNIKYADCVLIGVSFGGVLVQEISKHITYRKLIIVSSVKTMHELPKHMLLAKVTKVYKILPTKLATNIDAIAKYAFGSNVKKRLGLYKRYMSVSDSTYLDWAIEQMVNWNQEDTIPNIVHIHGENDTVFPIKNIENCITIKNGTHIMILNKYKWFNEHLPDIILSD